MEIIDSILPISLIVIGGLLIITELILGVDSLFDLFLSGTSLVIAGIVGLWSGNGIVAIVLAATLLLLYWIIGRSYAHKLLRTQPHASNSDSLVGVVTTIIRINKNGTAFVNIEGEEWRVESETDLNEGDKVRIKNVQGVTASVIAVNN